MEKKVIIYGKQGWPYTAKAREVYASESFEVDYRDVELSQDFLSEMLNYSEGRRLVPVIVEGKRVQVGYGGTWGV